jgi:ABC-type bacteriocin/lantibiotic exporter with double-glycine peptidase domain
MGAIVVWALATGAITGAVWIGTLLVSHLRKQAVQQPILLAQLEDRLQRLEAVERRLAEVEGRLEFAERLLAAGSPIERRSLPPERERA